MENTIPAPLERISSGAQLLIFIGITLILSFIGLEILGLLQKLGLINLTLIADPANYVKDEVMRDARNAQIIFVVFSLIAPSLLFAFLVSRKRLEYLQMNRLKSPSLILIGAITIIISLPVISYIAELNKQIPLPDFLQKMEQQGDDVVTAFEMHHTVYDLLANLFVIALLPALSEELFFRAGLQKILIRMSKNVHIGIWLTAIIFSAIHMQFSGFFPRMFLGAFLGYLFVWSGSIWVNIAAHFVFNACQIIVTYLQSNKISPAMVDNASSETPGYGYVIASALLVTVLIVIIYRLSKRKNSEIAVTSE